MSDDREADDVSADLVVFRREGCICIRAASPYAGDVQALMKEWNYHGFKRISGALASAWGCLVVMCRDYGHEIDVLGDCNEATGETES